MDSSEYFDSLNNDLKKCYDIANLARQKGFDPAREVEIPLAEDLALRVEKLIGVEDIAKRIRELSKENDRAMVALLIAKEIANRYRNDVKKALDISVRVGLGILTEGILVAPLEGIANIDIKNDAEEDYVEIKYAGPIRSAGGTAQALSILIADVVRRELNIGRYIPLTAEIERYKEEIELYNRNTHLQYLPSEREIKILVKNCPICISGEGTEKSEVSGFRDLPRINTNRVRGGMCLVLAEGVLQKVNKIKKYVDAMGIDGWEFLDDLIKNEDKKDVENPIKDSYKYMADMLAGRPVFSYPNSGFRLRYGRARTCGLGALAIHPATMYILDEFLAIGTQLKVERPGKAGGMTSCDSIEGPNVLLENGDFVEVDSIEYALQIKKQIKEIIDVGEILIPFGEFLENNHILLPGAYSIEWWRQELIEKDKKKEFLRFLEEIPDQHEVFAISKKLDIPLHPNYNLFWNDLKSDDIAKISDYIEKKALWKDNILHITKNKDIKNILITLGALHKEKKDYEIDKYSYSLLRCLGFELEKEKIVRVRKPKGEKPLEIVSYLSDIKVEARAFTRIGTRMGRPEKAKQREMKPAIHSLFPIGMYGGNRRLIKEAAKNKTIKVEVGIRICEKCGKEKILPKCKCGGYTRPTGNIKKIPIKEFDDIFKNILKNLRLKEDDVSNMKGVKKLMSSNGTVELLEKGVLRAKNDISVYKDGTIRYDMSDISLTHFKPKEIRLSLEKAKELGYTKDHKGNDLKEENQICDLEVQDIVVHKDAGKFFVRVANYIDDLLEQVYGMDRYYNVEKPEDMIGHLFMGLAPHTSGGVLVRLIGYTEACVCFAHPLFHAAKRRNCDGDEDSIMLLLDGLINFSREFLPSTRGGMMDAPLVLTLKINPLEVDKEALNVDIADTYPLEFYKATKEYKNPSEILDIIETIKDRVDTDKKYTGYGFTHDTTNINEGVLVSSYKRLNTMEDKINHQLELARIIRGVDENDVAARVVSKHFLPDIIGNLKKFGTQQFRCTKCNAKYNRIPLKGECTKCGNNLTLTIHRKSVIKYLERSKKITMDYDVSNYLRQRIELLERATKTTFAENVEEDKSVTSLEDFV